MKWDELITNSQGLVPCVVQDTSTKKVLMLAYMNEESLQKTLETKEMWFYSRSRQELWNKGATSGNKLQVVKLSKDCDSDSLLASVIPAGPACHTGAFSCFSENQTDIGDLWFLAELENIIRERKETPQDNSYTNYLFNHGLDKIAKKFGEEAFEVVLAAKNNEPTEVVWETADLLYHLMVLLNDQNVSLREVVEKLQKRHEV